jgi:Leucine-rich repeat (LRR) protein
MCLIKKEALFLFRNIQQLFIDIFEYTPNCETKIKTFMQNAHFIGSIHASMKFIIRDINTVLFSPIISLVDGFGLRDANVLTQPISNLQNLSLLKSLNLSKFPPRRGDRFLNTLILEKSSCFKNLISLNLSYNPIELEEACFSIGLESLQELILMSCNLKLCNEKSFQGLKSLLKLNLSKNELRFIKKGSFSFLKNLIHLNLAENKLAKIDHEWFDVNSNLGVLCLSGNHSVKLVENQFAIFPKLKKLFMNDMTVKSCPDSNLFNGLIDLTCLELKNGSFECLIKYSNDSEIFVSLPNLEILNLSYNKVGRINANLFKNLKKLVELGLNNCQISSIERGAFKALKKLKTLRLNHNLLSKLSRSHFAGLFSLQFLDLSECNISSVKENAFTHLSSSLIYLNMKGNYVTCFDEVTFACMNKLKFLDLSMSNKVDFELRSKSLFKDLSSSLKQLIIKPCSLTHIDSDTFKELKRLEILHLDAKQLNFNSFKDDDESSILNGLISLKQLNITLPDSYEFKTNLDLNENEIQNNTSFKNVFSYLTDRNMRTILYVDECLMNKLEKIKLKNENDLKFLRLRLDDDIRRIQI